MSWILERAFEGSWDSVRVSIRVFVSLGRSGFGIWGLSLLVILGLGALTAPARLH